MTSTTERIADDIHKNVQSMIPADLDRASIPEALFHTIDMRAQSLVGCLQDLVPPESRARESEEKVARNVIARMIVREIIKRLKANYKL